MIEKSRALALVFGAAISVFPMGSAAAQDVAGLDTSKHLLDKLVSHARAARDRHRDATEEPARRTRRWSDRSGAEPSAEEIRSVALELSEKQLRIRQKVAVAHKLVEKAREVQERLESAPAEKATGAVADLWLTLCEELADVAVDAGTLKNEIETDVLELQDRLLGRARRLVETAGDVTTRKRREELVASIEKVKTSLSGELARLGENTKQLITVWCELQANQEELELLRAVNAGTGRLVTDLKKYNAVLKEIAARVHVTR